MQYVPLSALWRMKVCDEVREALKRADPELFTRPPVGRGDAGTIAGIERNIDALVDIVRRSSATRVEPYLFQIMEDICTGCPLQDASTFCPLRGSGRCALYQNAAPVINAIASCLREIGDAAYLQNHPKCSAPLRG